MSPNGNSQPERINNTMTSPKPRPASICKYGNAAVIAAIALFFFVAPVFILLLDLSDPALGGRGVPRCARRWHRALSPRYARWARERVTEGLAPDLAKGGVSGTEWPLFGSVFYLLATEAMQSGWEANPAGPEPKVYAREAVDAAAALVTDPGHAGWVRDFYGNEYLHKENCFYRMLLISAAVSHANLTGSDQYLPMLRDQVETLSAEIDAAEFGWINDYPNECYPADVLVAVSAIQRADAVLGTDHSAFIRRALRGFSGERLDPATGLPPYEGLDTRGDPIGPARGCGNSYVCVFAPGIWPDAAREWYAAYEKHFWQRGRLMAGFREWPRGGDWREWRMDVDAGPVLDGFGTAASAFGLGAARTNGRFDHARPLAAEALVTSWPLPGGMLAMPRILSNAADAPYLGEACMLFNFTRPPAPGFPDAPPGPFPGYVPLALLAYLAAAAILILSAWLSLRRWRRKPDQTVPREKLQFALWCALILASLVVFLLHYFGADLLSSFPLGSWRLGLLCLLLAQFLPFARKKPAASSPAPAETSS